MAASRLYDMTPSQELTLLNRHWTVHKSIINIATSVTVHAELDHLRLEEAVRACVQRWDCFGMRFVKHGRTYRQYFGERDCLYIEHRRFTDEAEQDRWFAERARKRIPIHDSPQAGFVIFTTPDGSTGLFSVITHLIMDSWAISMFYRDVIEVYWALTHDEPLPKPPRDYEPVLAGELEYLRSDRRRADREFWVQQESGGQPFFTSIKGSAVLDRYRRLSRKPTARQCWTQNLRTRADHVVLVIAPRDVARFQAFLDEQGLSSMQVLFVLALRLYLAKQNRRASDIRLGVTVARRATLGEKNSGGSRVHQLCYRTELPEELTFGEAIELLLAKQNEFFRHADFGGLESVNLVHELYGAEGSKPGTGYCDIMLTYQPVPMALGHGLECSTQWHCNGAFSLPGYLTIMDDDGSGGLRCYWERQVRHLPVEVIRDCHEYMVEALRAGVARPSITLGELMSLGASGS